MDIRLDIIAKFKAQGDVYNYAADVIKRSMYMYAVILR
jgi:hypothetical protein